MGKEYVILKLDISILSNEIIHYRNAKIIQTYNLNDAIAINRMKNFAYFIIEFEYDDTLIFPSSQKKLDHNVFSQESLLKDTEYFLEMVRILPNNYPQKFKVYSALRNYLEKLFSNPQITEVYNSYIEIMWKNLKTIMILLDIKLSNIIISKSVERFLIRILNCYDFQLFDSITHDITISDEVIAYKRKIIKDIESSIYSAKSYLKSKDYRNFSENVVGILELELHVYNTRCNTCLLKITNTHNCFQVTLYPDIMGVNVSKIIKFDITSKCKDILPRFKHVIAMA